MNRTRIKAWLFTATSPAQIFSGYESIDGSADLLVAVDNGLERMQALGLKPALIIGDMDSVPSRLLEQYSTTCQLPYPTHKNETDTELAILWCLDQGIGEIVICNDLGGRFDHALGLIQNLAMLREKDVAARIESAAQRVFFLEENTHLEGHEGCLLSLFAWLGEAVFKDSAGLEYPLEGVRLYPAHSRGISNRVLSAEAVIRVDSGQVLAVLTK